MGLLDTMKQADEQQQLTSETLQMLMSQLDAQASQLAKLTKTVNDLSGYVKVMDEVHTAKLKALTSQQPELPSTLPLDDETKKRIGEIEKTLAALAKTVTDERVVTLSNGESVSASQLEALTLTNQINQQLQTLTRSSTDLAEAVTKRGQITIDPDKLAQHAVKVLDQRLAKAIRPSVARVEKTLAGFETKVAEVGFQRVSEASQKVEKVTSKAEDVVTAVRAAEARLEALEGKVTWTAVGRFCLALLPLSAVLLVIGGLVGAWHTPPGSDPSSAGRGARSPQFRRGGPRRSLRWARWAVWQGSARSCGG